jgi:uncharacterized protein YdcH (DUF465 family)
MISDWSSEFISTIAALRKENEHLKRRIQFANSRSDEIITLQKRISELESERLQQITKISLPTDTMEQQFQIYYSRGFTAGKNSML